MIQLRKSIYSVVPQFKQEPILHDQIFVTKTAQAAYSNPVPSVVKGIEITKVPRSSSLKSLDVKGNIYQPEISTKELLKLFKLKVHSSESYIENIKDYTLSVKFNNSHERPSTYSSSKSSSISYISLNERRKTAEHAIFSQNRRSSEANKTFRANLWTRKRETKRGSPCC